MTADEIRESHRRGLKKSVELGQVANVTLLPLNKIPGFAGGCGWQNHRPPADVEALKPITVAELELKKIHKGCVVWGTLCERAHHCGQGIYSVMQDPGDTESIVIVSFHSGFAAKTQSEAEVEFPIGANIGIQEPLFKVYRDGTNGIRVDNMQHVFGDLCLMSEGKSTSSRWKPPRGKHREHEESCHSEACQSCGDVPTSTKLLRCSGCRLAAYCNRACQKRHWKSHKSSCVAKQPGDKPCVPSDACQEGLYTKLSDFKVSRKPVSVTPEAQFRWSRDVWACSPPQISEDGRTATNVQMESVFCSTTPFGGDATTCDIRVLPPGGELLSLGVCMMKKGAIGRSWKYQSDGLKFCGDLLIRYGESYGVGDVVSVVLKDGNLSFAKNGKDLGVCYSGFVQTPPYRYYLRASLCAGYMNGMPIMGKANGGRLTILEAAS
eukprot:TRINITY_DN44004_c0_g1_i1.p1 TRINITY_DN44004_c0_g1~~TRINITY_DN44004_c0_g1_i1.p1  ORF type:complete len:491 (+),score=51.61 TRINITY_DN44004_c0_g1_i1:166-1473(+)